MSNLNAVLFSGYLGRDPELRYTPAGVPVVNFSVASSERWNNADGEKQERTTWYRCTAWRKLAETINEYLAKGRFVVVNGRLNPDPETGSPKTFTRNDGSPGASYEVTIRTIDFGPRQGEGSGGYQPQDEDIPGDAGVDDESIPF